MDIISNVPATLEWRVYKGDTTTLSIIVQSDEGAAIDVSDYEFLGQIRQDPTSATILQTLSINSLENMITVTITDSDDLPRMSYFDIQATKPDTTISTILKGYIYSEDDVSR